MIVRMKKVFVLAQAKDAFGAVDALRDLGSVHVEHEKAPSGMSVDERKTNIHNLEKAVLILREHFVKSNPKEIGDYKDLVAGILDAALQRNHLSEQMARRKSLIQQWELWGDFDPEDIKALAAQGIYIYLCEGTAREFAGIPYQVIIETVWSRRRKMKCVIISGKKVDLPVNVLVPPAMPLSQMKSLQEKDRADLATLTHKIEQASCFLESFGSILEKERLELSFERALSGMTHSDQLVYLKGYCPVDAVSTLQNKARQEKWGILLEDPTDDDQVPTLVRNPRWVTMIKPVFSLMNILPGYKELDISRIFLLFFSVFYGILIGDAAYGMIFCALTWWLDRKYGKKMQDRSIIRLMYVLNICAIVWGFLTGTFLGQNLFGKVIRPVLPWLVDNKNMQLLCFFLGAAHLSIAHIWRGLNKLPSIGALAEIGWLSMLWAAFFIARTLILGDPFPQFVRVFLFTGPLLVIFFNRPRKNIFKTIGLGLGDLALSTMNMFTDVVSYVRLFAVGAAGLAIANSFNKMLLDFGSSSWLTGIFAAVMLIATHALNCALGILAVLVHGVRLNILEFATHLNMEWIGIEYNPLRRSSEQIKT